MTVQEANQKLSAQGYYLDTDYSPKYIIIRKRHAVLDEVGKIEKTNIEQGFPSFKIEAPVSNAVINIINAYASSFEQKPKPHKVPVYYLVVVYNVQNHKYIEHFIGKSKNKDLIYSTCDNLTLIDKKSNFDTHFYEVGKFDTPKHAQAYQNVPVIKSESAFIYKFFKKYHIE